MKRTTYTATKKPGRCGAFRLRRTSWSMERAAWRGVHRAPVRKVLVNGAIIEQPITGTKQEHEDLIRERYLSRSKPYNVNGRVEAERRLRQMRTAVRA